ncbi:MAG: geranylgeranyl diphosphate synthase, type [Patescibacteria group bacterium]|nr:geranylgeranyl diphosphate synthase, type [Patescibacteria group bacterium]
MEKSPELAAAIAHVKELTDRELAVFFDLRASEAGKYDAQYKRLIQEMKKFSLRGGKRLRPFMTYLGYRLGGGKNEEAFARLALAWEVYHLGALIHDDIMDQDGQRYGGLNIAGVYEKQLKRRFSDELAHKHALNAALMAGDAAMLMAVELITTIPTEPEVRDRLLADFLKMHFRLVGGQFVEDFAALSPKLTPQQIRKIYVNKSGHYSMVAPLRSGAVLAGANDTILSILERYGLHAGVAFQITDDLLGMFGSAKEIGKPTITDLREGKRTLLMHYGLQFANDADKALIKAKYGNQNITTQDLKLVRKILTDNGAKAKTIFTAQAEAEAAKKAIAKLALPGDLPQLFDDLTGYLTGRSK